MCWFFFFNDTATTEIYTLSLHDALPISLHPRLVLERSGVGRHDFHARSRERRSEEHTSELQSRLHLVCRLLLEKKKSLFTSVLVLLLSLLMLLISDAASHIRTIHPRPNS